MPLLDHPALWTSTPADREPGKLPLRWEVIGDEDGALRSVVTCYLHW
jgi:hypothetical protein